MPGAHHLNKNISFNGSRIHSLTITGFESDNAVNISHDIACEKYIAIQSELMDKVSLNDLRMFGCHFACERSNLLSADRLALVGTELRARHTTANFTNIRVSSYPNHTRNGQIRMRHVPYATVSNVIFLDNLEADTTENGVLHIHDSRYITISNCLFAFTHNAIESRGVIHLHSTHNVTISECRLEYNYKSAIFAVDSSFQLSGSNNFTSNLAYEGGAIALFNSYSAIQQLSHSTQECHSNLRRQPCYSCWWCNIFKQRNNKCVFG